MVVSTEDHRVASTLLSQTFVFSGYQARVLSPVFGWCWWLQRLRMDPLCASCLRRGDLRNNSAPPAGKVSNKPWVQQLEGQAVDVLNRRGWRGQQ